MKNAKERPKRPYYYRNHHADLNNDGLHQVINKGNDDQYTLGILTDTSILVKSVKILYMYTTNWKKLKIK